jgi:hypothetical protein
MTNTERKERRRQAGLKAAETRRQQLAARPPEPPRVETADERARREHSAEEKRLANLRAVLRLAQEIRREGDLHYHAHVERWHHSPRRWTPEQIDAARRFLEGFRREDGTYDPHPVRRKGKWRL